MIRIAVSYLDQETSNWNEKPLFGQVRSLEWQSHSSRAEGKLARREEWRTMVLKEYWCVVEPMGADSPSQNGQAKCYNESIATTTRTLLYGTDLTAQYWSEAAIHSMYCLYCQPHNAINKTPYKAWWDIKPNLSMHLGYRKIQSQIEPP